jgi:hypothetical protein
MKKSHPDMVMGDEADAKAIKERRGRVQGHEGGGE